MQRGDPTIPERRSPWALVSILVVVVLFGLFWMIKENRIRRELSAIPAPASFSSTTDATLASIRTLQASVANLSIPAYSDAF